MTAQAAGADGRSASALWTCSAYCVAGGGTSPCFGQPGERWHRIV